MNTAMADVELIHIPEYLTARESAQRRDRLIQGAAILVAVGCIVAAGMMLKPINEQRKQFQLVVNPDEIKGLPPDIALMTKMGTLRLLAIDVAFSRMERLKEEGKFYELMQLSSWVCKLAPYYPNVWSYAAWNQAYNISVSEYNFESRWKWVKNGMSLLRDQGIQYNPKSIILYKELSWILWHKVADFADDANWHYKRQIAVEMESVLGAPPPAPTEEEMIEALRRIDQAPSDPKILIKNDSAVSALVDRLADVGLAPDEALLKFTARHLRPQKQLAELVAGTQDKTDQEQLQERRMAILRDPAHEEPLDRLLSSVRHRVLREQHKLEPARMVKLMEDYGPLDWRSPYAHSLYWAVLGDMMTKGQLNLDPSDSMNTVRFIFFALMNSIQRGRIALEPDFDEPGQSSIDYLPDTRFIPRLFDTYLRLGKEQFGADPDFREGTPGSNYWAGFVNWIREAIRLLYFEGGEANVMRAEEYLDYLRKMHPGNDGSIREEYLRSLDDFAMLDLKNDLISFKNTAAFISQLISRSLRELSLGRDEAAAGFMYRAELIWQNFFKDNPEARNRPETLPMMRREAVVEFIKSPMFPDIYKARLWDRLDVQTRQMTYDDLVPVVQALCERANPPLDPAKFLPEPPGMEEYRKNPVQGIRKETQDVEQGEKRFDPP